MLLDELMFEDPEFDLDLIEEGTEEIIQEGNIKAKGIGAPSKSKQLTRNIMITGSGDVSHQGRMKVSKPGIAISRSTSYNDYISIYRKNKDSIEFEGDLKKIQMNTKEYNYYEDLFIRNENLIQLVSQGNGKYDQYVDKAFVKDEQRRLEGLTVVRDTKGNASIYDKNNNLLQRENIMGERID